MPIFFLDANIVYGSNNFTAQWLYNLTDPNGLLAINQGQGLLPFDNVFPHPYQLTNCSTNIPYFLVGDL